MKEGSVLVDLMFPRPWPVDSESTILSVQPDDTSSCTVVACPGGHLRCSVTEADIQIASCDTQPIQIEGTGFAILGLTWNSTGISVYINGHELKSLQDASSEHYLADTRGRDRIGQGVLSYDHPEARKACKPWIDWRRHRYAQPKPRVKQGRRLKTEAEQVNELQDAVGSLADLIGLVQGGRRAFLPHIATQLRALLYWSDSPGSQYNPLLLRVAGRMALPLPVFAHPENATDPIVDGPPRPIAFYRGYQATLQRTSPKQELMDLQQFLECSVLIETFGDVLNASTSRDKRAMSIRQLILEFASMLGSAHYDDDVLQSLDLLRQAKSSDVDIVSSFLGSLAWVVVNLGVFVLREWGAKHTRVS